MQYGFTIEIQTQTNDADGNADETWMFIDGADSWGRIEMGDQDGAADRMFVAGEDSMPGRGGYDGAVGDVFSFSKLGDNNRSAFSSPGFDTTGDATKIIYFSPRFGGLQLGASFTPDSGQNGSDTINDEDGTRENTVSLGANYQMSTDDVSVTVGAGVEFGNYERVGADPTPIEDLTLGGILTQRTSTYDGDWQRWGLGAKLAFAGFEVSSGFVTQSDFRGYRHLPDPDGSTFAHSEGDDWWANIGLRYTTGPWKVGGGYFYSETEHEALRELVRRQPTIGTVVDNTEVRIFSIGANYNVAPGFDIATDLNFVDEETYDFDTPNDDTDGTVFVLSTIMSF